MAALYTVTNGVTADADDLNQIINTFANVFEISDTAQLALGRLVMPRSLAAAAPVSPIAGQQWFITDEGVDGRMYMRHNDDPVPHLPLRQIQKTSAVDVSNITSTSYVDSGLSISIITTGGRLRIYLVPEAGQQSTFQWTPTGSAQSFSGALKCLVGVNDAGALQFGQDFDANSALWQGEIPVGSFMWDYKPVAGAYTVKIQVKADSNTRIDMSNVHMIVEEWGD